MLDHGATHTDQTTRKSSRKCPIKLTVTFENQSTIARLLLIALMPDWRQFPRICHFNYQFSRRPPILVFIQHHVDNHVFWRKGQGSWVNPTSTIPLFKEILIWWTVGPTPGSPPFDFYSTIDLRCGLIYWILNLARDPQWLSTQLKRWCFSFFPIWRSGSLANTGSPFHWFQRNPQVCKSVLKSENLAQGTEPICLIRWKPQTSDQSDDTIQMTLSMSTRVLPSFPSTS
jgi:hypothetical protein